MTNLKILVFGTIQNGKLSEALKKANAINKSKNGPFSCLILLGDVFSKESPDEEINSFFNGTITLDLPTYFFYKKSPYSKFPPKFLDQLQREDPEQGVCGEIFPNFTCLGVSGQFSTTEGLTIGFDFDNEDSSVPTFKPPIHIFVSDGDCAWPKGIENETNVASSLPGFQEIKQSEKFKQDLINSKPKYHFTSRPQTFWERPPFKWSENEDSHITRFITLGDFGGPKKWFYAFSIATTTEDSDNNNNVGLTENPFENSNDSNQSLIWSGLDQDRSSKRDKNGSKHQEQSRPNKRHQQQKTVQPDNCFFCLSNSRVDRNLIVSIADESYLALAKGPLKLPDISIPHHLILIPLAHIPTPSHADSESFETMQLERQKYLLALNNMYSESNLVCVTFEISRNRGVHFHTQIIAVPNDRIKDLENNIFDMAKDAGFPIAKRELGSDENEYFKVDLPYENGSLIVELNNTFRFDLQFGRKVLANFLQIPEQIDWKSCSQGQKEEVDDSELFKKNFKKYDFTI